MAEARLLESRWSPVTDLARHELISLCVAHFFAGLCLEESLGRGLCLHCSLARPFVDLNARAPAHNRYMARTCSFEAGSDDDLRGVMNELGASAILCASSASHNFAPTAHTTAASSIRTPKACAHAPLARARSSCAPRVFKLAIPLEVRGDRRSREAGGEQAGN